MTTFSQVLQQHYEKHPQQVAITLQLAGQEDLPISYQRLIHSSAAYAKALEDQGIQPGEVVIIILQQGLDLISSFWGAILHGAIPSIMPFLTEKLHPDRYREELASLISITCPSAIITYSEFEAEVRSALKPDDSVRAVLISNDVPSEIEPDFSTLKGMQRVPEDIVLLQHSSGTTGLQKGVALSHVAVHNQLDSYSQAIKLNDSDVIVSWLPLYHDMGLIAGFLMPILRGVHLVLMSPFDWVRAPYKLMHAISKYKGTLAWLPNFAYNFCAKKTRDRHMEGTDLSSWRAVINCSEPAREESHQAFLERFGPYGFRKEALAVSYAMAENVFGVTQAGIDGPLVLDEIDRQALQQEWIARPAEAGSQSVVMVSAGPPIPNVEVCVFSKEKKGQQLPDRQIGEVALRSNCMLSGYYNRPDETEKAFMDGWYLTGDYGYMLNGEVYITGRKKDLIIVGGKNVYPQDLEKLAMEVSGVHAGRVVAFGVYDEQAGTEEVAVVAEVDTEDLEEHKRIAAEIRDTVTRGSAVALRRVHLVKGPWIIKTSSGKTARLANRDKYLAEIGE